MAARAASAAQAVMAAQRRRRNNRASLPGRDRARGHPAARCSYSGTRYAARWHCRRWLALPCPEPRSISGSLRARRERTRHTARLAMPAWGCSAPQLPPAPCH
eukprot:7387360-Prymnesium_polylepis.1